MKILKKIEYSDVDYSGHYKMSELFKVLSSLASEDAIFTGLWSREMIKDYGWIVTKQSLNLYQEIKLGDEIEIETLTGKNSMAIFPRYFFIYKDKELVGTVSSIWTMINLNTRAIVAPKRIGITIPPFTCKNPLEAPKSIIDSDMKYVGTRKVLYSDVDTNQHMNNTRYIEWALDILNYNIFKDHYINSLNINYKKEISPLEDIKLYYSNDNNNYIIKGTNNDNIIFIIQVNFS